MSVSGCGAESAAGQSVAQLIHCQIYLSPSHLALTGIALAAAAHITSRQPLRARRSSSRWLMAVS